VIVAIKATSQKKAMSIMRMIGATKGFISMPFIWEGIIYGLVGASLGWTACYIALLYATPSIQSFLGEIILLPVPWQFLVIQAGSGVLLGALLGGLAGLLAVVRLVKR
jgi:cell division transport system permease protein